MDTVVAAVDFAGVQTNVNSWLVIGVGIALAFFGYSIVGKVLSRTRKTG